MNNPLLFSVVASVALLSLFKVILKSNTVALGLIFTTAFTRVLFHLVGLPRYVPVLFTEICVLLLLGKALYLRVLVQEKPLRATGLFPMLGILAVSMLSYIYNEADVLPAVFFFRKTFVFYLFFIAVLNLDLSEATTKTINKYIILLFLIQIPASIIKLMLVGQKEGTGIGTVSWEAGTLSTTLPLFAIAFLCAFYFFRKRTTYLVLIFGFICFGIIGEKRAVWFLIPVVVIFITYLYGKRASRPQEFFPTLTKNMYFMKVIIVCVIGALGVIHLINADLSITLKPREWYRGSDKVRHIVDYIAWYHTREYVDYLDIDNPQNTLGRARIMMVSCRRLKEAGAINVLLGFGPGSMITSPHLNRENAVFEQFGIRGAMPGLVIFVLQTGLLGVCFLTYFLVSLLRKAYARYRQIDDTRFKMVALGFMGATFVFLLDFFIYSESSLSLGVLTTAYFYVASLVLRGSVETCQVSKSVCK